MEDKTIDWKILLFQRDELIGALRRVRAEAVPSRNANNHDHCQFGRIDEIASKALAPYKQLRLSKQS